MSTEQRDVAGPEGQPPAWAAATTDVLAAHGDGPPARRRSWPMVAGAAALVLALVGGVTYAVGALSGGGQQPAEALPAGAFGVLSIDLDPPAGQKIDAFRFLRKFPSLRDRVPLDGDLRQVAFETVADAAGWQDVDFDADVSPWLGKRVALAVYPPAGDDRSPQVAVALQVTDQDKADQGLRTLSRVAGSGSAPVGWSFSGDYALVSTNAMVAKDLATRAATSPLSADDHFVADTASLDDGVVLAWADLGRATDAMGTAVGSLSPQLLGTGMATGRTTVVARFDGADVFEVSGRTTGAVPAGWPSHGVRGVADLPASSVLALGLADGDALVGQLWKQVGPVLGVFSEGQDPDQVAENMLGLRMPDDLATLIGDNFLLAVDSGDDDGQVAVGARITTDTAKAGAILDRMAARGDTFGVQDFLTGRRTVGDDLVVASTPAEVERLAARGSLGDVSAFRTALPDLDGAALAFWVDPPGVEKAVAGFGEPDKDLAALAGIGVTVSVPKDGASTFRLRVVTH